MKISYIIGTHNEPANYIKPLLDQLLKFKDPEDEIIVVDDFSTSQETIDTLAVYQNLIRVEFHALNGDFAAHKNYMNSLAGKDSKYIVNIDCDEVPHENLLKCLKEILLSNSGVDLFYVPRINLVPDLPKEYITKWGWNVSDKGWINYPDLQGRIYRNSPTIKWIGTVHEVISGHATHTVLPTQDEEGKPCPDYCLLHIKTAEKQIASNSIYETMLQR